VSPDQQFWLAILAQACALVIGLVTLWLKVNDLHKDVNGRMTQLVDLTAKSSRAEGVLSTTTPLHEQPSGDPAAPRPS
jgi:hypothetical protein